MHRVSFSLFLILSEPRRRIWNDNRRRAASFIAISSTAPLCVSGRYAGRSLVSPSFISGLTAPGDDRAAHAAAHDFDCGCIDPRGPASVDAGTSGARVVVGPPPVVAALCVCVSVTVNGLLTQVFRQIVRTLDTGPAGRVGGRGRGRGRLGLDDERNECRAHLRPRRTRLTLRLWHTELLLFLNRALKRGICRDCDTQFQHATTSSFVISTHVWISDAAFH